MTNSDKPIALEDRAAAEDARLFSPSAGRNRDAILVAFSQVLPQVGAILEIGAGTGEHAVALARALPDVTWIPSDPDPASRASIRAWIAFEALPNIAEPFALDVRDLDWGGAASAPFAPFAAIVSINMIHIAPWSACEGLFAGAGRQLAADGRLVLYGPFSEGGAHTAASNAAFDEALKARDPAWGVRDLVDLDRLAALNGLARVARIAMPANNLTLAYERRAE